MTAPLCRMAARLRRFGRSEGGTSTIEFALLFPLFAFLLCSATESGILMVRQVMLDRAVDMVVRDLRIGLWDSPNHDTVKAAICDAADVIPNCVNTVLLELRGVDKGAAMPSTGAVCVDRAAAVQPVTTFYKGAENEMMLVRACAVFDPVFPGAGLGLRLAKDHTGAYALVSASAFVNEPS